MSWFKKSKINTKSIVSKHPNSVLVDEKGFYDKFTQDLLRAKKEVIIESPFITIPRLRSLKPIFEILVKKDVEVFILTKPPIEHDEIMSQHSEFGIKYFEVLGAQVLLCEGHHRKMALIDRKVVWKGSLNILSQANSREIMERDESREKAEALFKFLKYNNLRYFRKNLD